jgi:hypothetical protein
MRKTANTPKLMTRRIDLIELCARSRGLNTADISVNKLFSVNHVLRTTIETPKTANTKIVNELGSVSLVSMLNVIGPIARCTSLNSEVDRTRRF